MRRRIWSAYPLGLAIAVSLGAASAALAQADISKSRVPVTKEQAPPAKMPATTPAPKQPVVVPKGPVTVPSAPEPESPVAPIQRVAPGDVAPPRDTALATVARPECAMMPNRTAPMGRRMAEMCGAMMPSQAQPTPKATRYLFGSSGFYIGLGAGTAVPYNHLSNLGYDSGLDITVPVGWHRPGRTLGIRATLAFDQVHADMARIDVTAPAMRGSAPDPKIYSGSLDAVLKFPIGQTAREGRGLSVYTVGGGGLYLFRGFGGATQLGDVLGGDDVGNSRKNVHKWGVGAGAGLEWGIGPTAVFFESRFVNVFTDGSRTGNDHLRWIPISVGVMVR